ncbi:MULTISPECIES: metallophosphoesterase family protein [Clostridium]|uniref:3',5'-cyclic AMP phosphodiesterase CpdA n=1 Tax=Clostridium intestinale DSM 6191 TaxID=1121320 RepID=A0A1M5ZPP7_9CLOT|nr:MULTISPECIES: metallophosphoesterase [Clostridium]SHI26099.1 3',5'-cyclic AMP phosphodiesterase CpdA [Clostridium intestinale DSM 6191]
MKRFRVLIIIAVIFVVGIIASLVIKNQNGPVNKDVKTAEIPDVDLSFGVFGDVHENVDSFQKAINDMYTINPGINALVLNGDSVDQGLDVQYKSMKDTINKNKDLLPDKIIKNIGNHEFFDYEHGENSAEDVQDFISKYLDFSGEDKVYHDTWVNNYHFISLGSEDGNSETLNSVKAYISPEQQNWLKEKLAEKYEKGKPIFVFLHQHLSNGKNGGWVGSDQADEVRQILDKYPEVILFTSHTHRDLTESSVVLDQPFTTIHTGAIHYTIIPDENSEGGRRNEPYIKGLYVEVNGNKVTVKGRDFKEKQWIFSKEISK